MQEFFKINGINVGFANHPTDGTSFVQGALDTEVAIRKGKLNINIVSPAFEITDAMHNGLLANPYYDDQRYVDYVRLVTYQPVAVGNGTYNTKIVCPYGDFLRGLEFGGCFPMQVTFRGVIDVQEGFVHIKGRLESRFDPIKSTIPIEVVKTFEPKPLLPKRTELSLTEALTIDPLSVYELRIREGEFKEFPKEVLSFKNLEAFAMGWQANCNFNTLPEAFYDLTHLHTLIICRTSIAQLSEKIANLQKLEELSVTYSDLQALPDSVCQLPQLTEMDVRSNQLTQLPENIGNMKNLRKINLAYNPIQKLPLNLANIPYVTIDRKHRKLYKDDTYPSENPAPIDTSLYDLSHYSMFKKLLEEAALAVRAYAPFKDLIIDYSTVATLLIHDPTITDVPLGASKVFGTPDLPKGWAHPANKNGHLYTFHAQINCKEIAPFQAYLPREGMLYFFIADENEVEQPMVLYAENDAELVPYPYSEATKFINFDKNGELIQAVALRFRNSISLPNFYNAENYGEERFKQHTAHWERSTVAENLSILADYDFYEALEKNLQTSCNTDLPKRTHSINSNVFTQNESPQELAAQRFGGEPEEWLVLLNLESVGDFNFGDAGTFTYCMHKKDLAIRNFKTIFAGVESS